MFKELVMAIYELHTNCKLAHLDIKPDNVILTLEEDLLATMLIDLGLS